MFPRTVALCAALVVLSSLRAQEAKPGLKKGADLPGPLRPYHVANGKNEGQYHCPVCAHGLNPGVLVFVKNMDFNAEARWKPLQALLKDLDTYIAERPKARLKAAVVFFDEALKDVAADDDARTARADEIRKRKGDLAQVMLTLDSPANLQKANYDLDPAAEIVVVLYDRLKIHEVYSQLTEADVAKIVTEVKEKLAPAKK